MYYPRLLNRIWAFLMGYFWLPCPICNKNFGGHEWSESLMIDWGEGEGEGTCPKCIDETRKRNKLFMKEVPPPSVWV